MILELYYETKEVKCKDSVTISDLYMEMQRLFPEDYYNWKIKFDNSFYVYPSYPIYPEQPYNPNLPYYTVNTSENTEKK